MASSQRIEKFRQDAVDVNYCYESSDPNNVTWVEINKIKYTFTKHLDKGAYGNVNLFTDSNQNCIVVKTPHSKPLHYRRLNRELKYQEKSYPKQHSYFITTNPSTLDKDGTPKHIYLIEPYFFGDHLDEACQKISSTKEYLKLLIALIKELKRIHSLDIFHGDIKSSNLKIYKDPETGKFIIYFIDFGLSCDSTWKEMRKYELTDKQNSSHIAPEMFVDYPAKIKPSPSPDIYSIADALKRTLSSVSHFIKRGDTHLVGLNPPASLMAFLKSVKSLPHDQRPSIDDLINLLKNEYAKILANITLETDYHFSTPDFSHLESIRLGEKIYLYNKTLLQEKNYFQNVFKSDDGEEIETTNYLLAQNNPAQMQAIRRQQQLYPHDVYTVHAIENLSPQQQWHSIAVTPHFPGDFFDEACEKISSSEMMLKMLLATAVELQRIHSNGCFHGNIISHTVKVNISPDKSKFIIKFILFDSSYSTGDSKLPDNNIVPKPAHQAPELDHDFPHEKPKPNGSPDFYALAHLVYHNLTVFDHTLHMPLSIIKLLVDVLTKPHTKRPSLENFIELIKKEQLRMKAASIAQKEKPPADQTASLLNTPAKTCCSVCCFGIFNKKPVETTPPQKYVNPELAAPVSQGMTI